jgi:hypothetical protein
VSGMLELQRQEQSHPVALSACRVQPVRARRSRFGRVKRSQSPRNRIELLMAAEQRGGSGS